MDNTPHTEEAPGHDQRSTGAPQQNNTMRTVLIVLVLAVAAVLVWMFVGNTDRAVAEVNGETITRGEYEQAVESLSQSSSQSGTDVSTSEAQAQIQSQALQTLINQQVVLDAAEAEGVTVSEEEIDTELEQLRSQTESEEAFQQQLTAAGLTEEDLRGELRLQLRLQKFLDTRIPEGATTVTDEEVRSMYDTQIQNVSDSSSVPAFSEVESTLRTQLQNQKRTQETQGVISELRDEADIEIFIDDPASNTSAPQPTQQQQPQTPGTNNTTPDTTNTSETESNEGGESTEEDTQPENGNTSASESDEATVETETEAETAE